MLTVCYSITSALPGYPVKVNVKYKYMFKESFKKCPAQHINLTSSSSSTTNTPESKHPEFTLILQVKMYSAEDQISALLSTHTLVNVMAPPQKSFSSDMK